MSSGLAPNRPSFRLSQPGTLPIRIPEPANDNVAPGRPPQSEEEIRAALGHFAQHHLNAAHDAHARAKSALASGDEENFVFWANICRALDRRLAGTLSAAWGTPV
tara:strand:+ start:1001 stop:1315 length:315 start_codon:yes stop_codon:yes gene_type:complete